MYIETGASARHPFRKMFDNQQQAIRDFNKYKAYSNVYHSIYWFREKEEKFDRSGKLIRIGPDYNTAIITRIVLDLDSWKTIRIDDEPIEVYSDEALISIRKFAEWCEKKNYTRQYIFSGGGFYGIVQAYGHPLKLRDGMLTLGNELGLDIDPATVGDTSRMMRVLNSFNFGDHRKCYCIPLKEEEIQLEFGDIHSLAVKPRLREKYIYGDNSFSLEKFKIDDLKIKKKELFIDLKQNLDAECILAKYGWSLEELCDTIKHIISKKYVGHYLRYELIKYFRSVVHMDIEDVVNLMAALLKDEGVHSLAEGQAQFIYNYNRVFNPKKLKALGYCPVNCFKCMRLRNII